MKIATGSHAGLYEAIREAVHRRWDPIGVNEISNEMGEYDGYIPSLCEMLQNDPDRDQIFEYLWTMETDAMGLTGDRRTTEQFAEWLYQLAISMGSCSGE